MSTPQRIPQRLLVRSTKFDHGLKIIVFCIFSFVRSSLGGHRPLQRHYSRFTITGSRTSRESGEQKVATDAHDPIGEFVSYLIIMDKQSARILNYVIVTLETVEMPNSNTRNVCRRSKLVTKPRTKHKGNNDNKKECTTL